MATSKKTSARKAPKGAGKSGGAGAEPTEARTPAVTVEKAPAIKDVDLFKGAMTLLDEFDGDEAKGGERWNEVNTAWWSHWLPDETVNGPNGTRTKRGDPTRIERLAMLLRLQAPPATILDWHEAQERSRLAYDEAMKLLGRMEDPEHRQQVRKVLADIHAEIVAVPWSKLSGKQREIVERLLEKEREPNGEITRLQALGGSDPSGTEKDAWNNLKALGVVLDHGSGFRLAFERLRDIPAKVKVDPSWTEPAE